MASLIPIRIVLGWMPRLAGDLVESAVAAEADMAIVARAEGKLEALSAVRRTGAQVFIGAEPRASDDAMVVELLNEHAHLKVVTVTADARLARLYELREQIVREVSPRALVAAIRHAVRSRSAGPDQEGGR